MPTLADKLKAPKTDTASHVIVEALAGTGKTTTIVEGLKAVKGFKSSLTPSPQQAAVWKEMAKSKGKAKTIAFAAFNKSIATELAGRVPQGCEAFTMHSMGLRAVTKALGRMNLNSADFVVGDIIAGILGREYKELRAKDFILLNATEKLVSLCKMNLVGGSEEELDQLAAHYDIELNGSRSQVFDLVPKVLEACKAPKGKINYDDMIWLPVVLNMPIYKYDLLLVDEAQDLNRCQQELARRAGERLILCGDPNQAIYGFAGADSKSMSRMEELLGETPRGVVKLPLTVTRRCGKAIVAEARSIVPTFEAHESNGEGKITRRELKTYGESVNDGDMILCRTNAPLVSQCFKFIRAGRKANIAGRDIGQGLISTVKNLAAPDIDALETALDSWLEKETEKENKKSRPSESKLIALQDRHDCLLCFVEASSSVEDVIRRIEEMSTDKKTVGIRLSSIHKSKGLESDRVFLLEPKGATVPHPMARSEWQVGQEWNLRYVAITRAIQELIYVTEAE